jgi:23S rRNA (cytosine1962-C5)-methyltransferase
MKSSILGAVKPHGIATHSPSSQSLTLLRQRGYSDILQEKYKEPLEVVHRLDKEVSGVIIFSKSSQTTRFLCLAFAEQKVSKEYLFITEHRVPVSSFVVNMPLKQVRNNGIKKSIVSSDGAHSETYFSVISSDGSFSLLRAMPKSGRMHQIRAHAAAQGIPILGDTLYGGRAMPRLMLHSERLSLTLEDGEKYQYTAQPPRFFTELKLLNDHFMVSLLSGLYKRLVIAQPITFNTTLRVIHFDDIPWMTADKLGPVLWVNWYRPTPPTSKEEEQLSSILPDIQCSGIFVNFMENKGMHGVQQFPSKIIGNVPEVWNAVENNIDITLSRIRGHSPGIFVDQRGNRSTVRSIAKGRTVLNLFSYSGLFSISAGLGEAKEVISVDTSKTALAWCNENWTKNNLHNVPHSTILMDARSFLERAYRRGNSFVLIICDPPSFSRGKGTPFSIKRDYQLLLKLLFQVTKPKGIILFVTNYAEWEHIQFCSIMTDIAKKYGALKCSFPLAEPDISLTGVTNFSKSVLFEKDELKPQRKSSAETYQKVR